MAELSSEQKAEYLHRCYTAVDGLWFMKLEERLGFEEALAVDTEVWKVMPKLQARKLRELTGAAAGLAGLRECFGHKLRLDGFSYQVQAQDGRLEYQVSGCPWYELLRKSGRQALAGRIGERICQTEYNVWAAEFGPGIAFEMRHQLCTGGLMCRLCFVAQ